MMRARRWFFWLFLAAFFVTDVPASAERIITVGEVSNRVKVRHRPALESPSIGSLQYNESAELLESLPYWYHIKLDNGVPGYISRAWTRKLSEAEGDGGIARAAYWKIAAADHGEPDWKLVAQIINAQFDVIAIAGLSRPADGQPSAAQLLKDLGPGWAGLQADAPPNTAGTTTVAILYRKALIRPCADGKGLVSYGDGGTGGAAAPDVAFACFEAPMNKSSMTLDFIFGIQQPFEDGGGADFAHINKAIAAVQAAHQPERDIIIAGTFNVSAADLQDGVEARVRTKGAGSVLDPQGELTGNLYDHMLILDENMTIETVDAPHVVDVRSAAASNSEFYQRCSRHLPILLRLRTTGPDDD